MRYLAADWFRTKDWDEAAREEFERRLGRASVRNRPQYLRIKGLALSDAGQVDAARELWVRVIREFPGSLDAPAAIEHLADMERKLGANEAAEHHYRELLDRSPTLNGTSGMAEVSLAELLIERDNAADREEALKLLDLPLRRGRMLPDQLFRWHVALARAASDMGDRETQQRAARTALRLAREAPPPFPRHPTVGVVHADAALIAWLDDLAAGRVPKRSTRTRRPRWLRKRGA